MIQKPPLLLVDDEPFVTGALSTLLRRTWTVSVASSGDEALAALAGARFNAIVCDVMMPGMTGIQLAERIAATDPAMRARMVFLTGGADSAESVRFLERDDVRHLPKPVSRADLDAALADFRDIPA
jgi:CheY-like chemotaxis protein